MNWSIRHPEWMFILDAATGVTTFGPNQAWFNDPWAQKAGCAAVSGAAITAYLSKTQTALSSLYLHEANERASFVCHMEELFQFVAPGMMGVNRVEMFVDGMRNFSIEKGALLTPHVLAFRGLHANERPPLSALAEFVAEGLSSDCPIALLVLSRAKEKRLQNWHWITIVSAEIRSPEEIIATATDEGKERVFNLSLWYRTTRMNGGLIWFTSAKVDSDRNRLRRQCALHEVFCCKLPLQFVTFLSKIYPCKSAQFHLPLFQSYQPKGE